MKILFIEDHEELNTIGSLQLEDLGHDVLSAFSVEQARRIYAENKNELGMIIADHRLPDGLGLSFLEVLREAGCSIPSVVVSGCLTSTERKDLERKHIPFFLKPVLYGEMLSEVEHAERSHPHSNPARDSFYASEESDRGESGMVCEDKEEDDGLTGVPSGGGFFRRLFSHRLVTK